MKKFLIWSALLATLTAGSMKATNSVHASDNNSNGNVLPTTEQVPENINNYWLQWNQVKLTSPIKAQLISYKSTKHGLSKKIVNQEKTIPSNTTLYVKGSGTDGELANDDIFEIVNSKNDPVYVNKGISSNTPRWITNSNNVHSFQLTKQNNPIKNLHAKSASIDKFNNQWEPGYLNQDNVFDNSFPLLVKDYKSALNIRKVNSKLDDLGDDDLDNNPYIPKGENYLKKMSKVAYKFKSTDQKVLVRNYKNNILQVKIGSQIYYDSNNTNEHTDFLPYNTIIESDNEIQSSAVPISNDINNVVVPKNGSLYTTKGEKWYSTAMNNKGKSMDKSYVYNGNSWSRPSKMK